MVDLVDTMKVFRAAEYIFAIEMRLSGNETILGSDVTDLVGVSQ